MSEVEIALKIERIRGVSNYVVRSRLLDELSELLIPHLKNYNPENLDCWKVFFLKIAEDNFTKYWKINLNSGCVKYGLPLSKRIFKALKNENIIFVGDLATKSWSEILSINNIGVGSFKEIRHCFQEGLKTNLELTLPVFVEKKLKRLRAELCLT